MNSEYKFLSNIEPTDEQLHSLMKEVAKDVKMKAQLANELFWRQLQQMIKRNSESELSKNIDLQ